MKLSDVINPYSRICWGSDGGSGGGSGEISGYDPSTSNPFAGGDYQGGDPFGEDDNLGADTDVALGGDPDNLSEPPVSFFDLDNNGRIDAVDSDGDGIPDGFMDGVGPEDFHGQDPVSPPEPPEPPDAPPSTPHGVDPATVGMSSKNVDMDLVDATAAIAPADGRSSVAVDFSDAGESFAEILTSGAVGHLESICLGENGNAMAAIGLDDTVLYAELSVSQLANIVMGMRTAHQQIDGLVLDGGDATGQIIGTDCEDMISYDGSSDNLQINLSNNNNLNGDAEGDKFVDIEHVQGGDGDDRIIGNTENNILIGGDGDDAFNSKGGSDIIIGGMGKDTMAGDTGSDVLFGDQSEDRLNGGAGDDIIVGGVDNDRLWGSTGADVFIFSAGDGYDRIEDFEDGIDRIVILEESSFADLTITQVGGNVEVEYGDGDTLFFKKTDESVLDESDFFFL